MHDRACGLDRPRVYQTEVTSVAGHRLSTGEMEEVLASHPAVAECAVIGVNDEPVPPTIEDASTLEALRPLLRASS
jgi:acyl-CoA synthetase (AMP-forming)/AMP-acid ligase II